MADGTRDQLVTYLKDTHALEQMSLRMTPPKCCSAGRRSGPATSRRPKSGRRILDNERQTAEKLAGWTRTPRLPCWDGAANEDGDRPGRAGGPPLPP